MAQESEDEQQLLDAMKQLISDCTFNKVNADKCPLFDAEYIFLQIRSKSVGETISVNITCPDDKKTVVPKEISISDIKVSVFDDHSDEVQITDDIKMIFANLLNSIFLIASIFNIIQFFIIDCLFFNNIFKFKIITN